MSLDQLLHHQAPSEDAVRQHTELCRDEVLRRATTSTLTTRVRPTRRRTYWIASGMAAALALGLVLLPSVLGERGPSTAAGASAAVLQRAAEVTASAATPQAGQYRYVRDVVTNWSGTNGIKGDGVVQTNSVVESWVPDSTDRPWIQRTTEGDRVIDTTAFTDFGPRLYREYPADPERLLAALHTAALAADQDLQGGSAGPKQKFAKQVWDEGFRVLQDPVAPPRFKADVLRALATLPGVSTSKVSLNGLPEATALSLGGDSLEQLFDTRSGGYLGWLGHIEGSPDGITDYTVIPSTKIVDTAPTPDQ